MSILRELHRIHQQLVELRDRHVRGPKQIRARRDNVTRLEEEFKQAKANTKAARMAADEKQLQLKTGEGKIADLRVKLNQAASNREYQALLEQIAADEMANSVLEDEVLEGLGKIDEYIAATTEAERNVKQALDELAGAETNITKDAERITGDITRLEAELKRAQAELPGDFQQVYVRAVESRGPDGMAQVEGECCSGCYQQIPPNRVNQLFLKQAVLCSSCGRLLYLPEDRTPGR